MNTTRWIAVAAALVLAGGTAQALSVVKRPSGTGVNLLSNACSFADGASDNTVTGCLSNNHGQAVTLTSDESIDYVAGGQVRVRGSDSGYSRLSIKVDDRSMEALVLNLTATADGFVAFSDGINTSELFKIKGVGSNFFTIRGSFETLSYTTYSDRLGTESDLVRDTGQLRFALVEQTAPIPEPSAYVLILAGLGLVGFVVRQRRRDHRDGA